MQHKAHTLKEILGFDGLVSMLEVEVERGYINKIQSEDFPELFIYDYSRSCMTENYWPEACQVARGLVLNFKEEKVQACGPVKFYNLSEDKVSVSKAGSFKVYEKLDGSCGLVYFYNGEWRVNTRGSFKSDQAAWGKNFIDNLDTSNLKEGWTYVLELCYPENTIVVSHQNPFVGVLMAYTELGEEIEPQDAYRHFMKQDGIVLPRVYTGKTIQDLVFLAENELDHNDEGFVVLFENGQRVKIKSAAYVAVHKMISHFSRKAVFDFFADYPEINPFDDDSFKNLPEEFYGDLCCYYSEIQTLFAAWVADGTKFYSKNFNLTNKQVGVMLKEKKVEKRVANIFFDIRNRKLGNLYSKSADRRRIVKQILALTKNEKS